MAIRYFNIKHKPNAYGFAIQINTENISKRTIEALSSDHSFNEIRKNEKYSHFEIIEGDYSIIGDRGDPVILKRGGKEPLAKVCLDNLGNIRLHKNKENLLYNEISKEEAEDLKEFASNWKLTQSWILS